MPARSVSPVIPRCPADTLAFADLTLVVAILGLGLTVAVAAWDRGPDGLTAAPALFGGWLVGVLGLRIYPHRFRVLGLAPLAATLAIPLVLMGWGLIWPTWLVACLAGVQGVAVGAVLRYRDYFRGSFNRFSGAAFVGAVLGLGAVALFATAGKSQPGWRDGYQFALLGQCLALAAIAWGGFSRAGVEMLLDPVMRFMYAVRVRGPGRHALPRSGPCLVMANHAAWFDPLFVAEAVPRETAPMMTAGFYDLPGLRWLMRCVFRVIRVPEQPARREAPEVREAIAALDVGQCLVIFPEGYLRRKEKPLIRRFGQGIWQILRERPDTPVIACWIEGSWGSYYSYRDGPPTKNKKHDIRRPVSVGISEPVQVPTEVLAHHLLTRVWLMNRVLEARAHLGLPAVEPVELPSVRSDEADE